MGRALPAYRKSNGRHAAEVKEIENMGITRKMLKAMELDDDKISQIIDAHQSVIEEIATERDAFKADAEKYKAEAERLGSVEKDLVKAQAKLEDADKTAEKLKALRDEFDSYKADVDAKASQAQKEKAYRALLAEAGISDKRFDSIIKVSDLSSIEFDKDGNVKDSKNIVAGIKSEWADFISTQDTKGAQTATPPASDPSKVYTREDIKHMSADEINKNWDSIKDSLNSI
jgi:ATP-dependent Lon protease